PAAGRRRTTTCILAAPTSSGRGAMRCWRSMGANMGERTAIAWCDQRPVAGFPGYHVTSSGDVLGRNGRALRPGGVPRPIVVLYRDGKPATRQVCRLVLEAFVGP